MPVKVQLMLVGDSDLTPEYAKKGDAGCDARANIKEPVYLIKDKPTLIPLGIRTAIPEGYEIQVRARSGLALKNGVVVIQGVGTVDPQYRGEICAVMINHTNFPFTVNPGDRICQLVLNKVEQIQWERVSELPLSDRGEGGFGHSGV